MSAIKAIHPDFHPNLETFDPEYKKGAQSERNAEASRPREDQFGLLMAGKMQDAGFDDHSRADFRLCQILTRTCNGNRALMDQMFRQSGLMREKWDEQHGSDTYGNITLNKALAGFKAKSNYDGDGSDWRENCDSYSQLGDNPPKFLIGGLVPEKALTFITAPSYHCKTWLALAIGKAVYTGSPLWCFDGPEEPVPVIYHVPEMNAALVRQRMSMIGIGDTEMFLTRTMERGVWPLDDERMLRSSEGRLVFLDTQGFFNPAEDASDYKASLRFGQLVFNLLANGAAAVTALAHPPKYATKLKDEPAWTLENSVLGSAGYGGILRSCLRVKNLAPDLNDPNVQVYVQGMKNPGLKPFQLEGLPLRMKLPPGESPYLESLQAENRGHEDPRKAEAFNLWQQKIGRNKIALDLHVSKDTVSEWIREWEAEFKEQNPDLPTDF